MHLYVPVYSVCPHVCRYQCTFMKSRGGVSCSITSHSIPLRQCPAEPGDSLAANQAGWCSCVHTSKRSGYRHWHGHILVLVCLFYMVSTSWNHTQSMFVQLSHLSTESSFCPLVCLNSDWKSFTVKFPRVYFVTQLMITGSFSLPPAISQTTILRLNISYKLFGLSAQAAYYLALMA